MSKRITILGAGESGTGAAILALTKGYTVFVSDANAIKPKYRDDLLRHKIDFEEGKHTPDRVLNADVVVKSPGIPDKAEIVKQVKAANIPVIDEIEFAFPFIKGKVVAITGTNGKTTTTLLTHHLMLTAGLSVTLAGNVGESLARKVAYEHYDWYVLEVSSFQLDGTLNFKPAIGILLNITPDHLDRYGYKLENYVDSKFQLIRNMTSDDNFICFTDDNLIRKGIETHRVKARLTGISLTQQSQVYFDGEKMCFDLEESFSVKQKDTTLRGKHNLVNTMAAVSAVHMAGAKLNYIFEGLKSFKNAPHRMELVASISGVDYVNDSKATNVDAVSYALESYDRPLVWIAGGIDKGNDYGQIRDAVAKKVRTLICLGKDNEKLKDAFGGVVGEILETTSVPELVRLAAASAKEGDVVLLSPACASFDLFKNYEDRGDQFRSAVLEYRDNLNRGAL